MRIEERNKLKIKIFFAALFLSSGVGYVFLTPRSGCFLAGEAIKMEIRRAAKLEVNQVQAAAGFF